MATTPPTSGVTVASRWSPPSTRPSSGIEFAEQWDAKSPWHDQRRKREAILFKIQQLTIDRTMFAPVMDLRALMGVGPRVTKHTITDVWMSPFPSYEDMALKE